MNYIRTIRNNWKKSLFAAGLVSYGAAYGRDKYIINQLMREYCEEAATYGDELLPIEAEPRKVLVILNPTADKRNSETNFSKYCEPILHLAGITVDVVKTDSEGHARTYVETELQALPEAIIVAGGDGTLSEVVTGLLRRTYNTGSCTVAALPVGRTSSVANALFRNKGGDGDSDRVANVRTLANSAISIVRGKTVTRDVMKIELIGDDEGEGAKKPVYSLASIKWGAFRDAMNLRDKYWYLGPWRDYASIFFNAFKSTTLNWYCNAALITTPPCEGCQNCYVAANSDAKPEYKSRNWWSFIIPSRSSTQKREIPKAMLVSNPECNQETERRLANANELLITTANVDASVVGMPKLHVRQGMENKDAFKFIKEGWRRVHSDENEINEMKSEAQYDARTVTLVPEQQSGTVEAGDGSPAADREVFYSIDNEDYEAKPIRITLLPQFISVFSL